MPSLTIMSNLNGETQESLTIKVNELLNNIHHVDENIKISSFRNFLPEIAVIVHLAVKDITLKELSAVLVKELCCSVFNFERKPHDQLLILLKDAVEPDVNMTSFFKCLHSLLNQRHNIFDNISGNDAAATLMNNILIEILRKNKINMEPMKVLSLFCFICGLDVPLQLKANSCFNGSFQKQKMSSLHLPALSSIFEACAEYSQYFNTFTPSIEFLQPIEWLEGAMNILLDSRSESNLNTWLKVMHSFFKISLELLEKHLIFIIKVCILNIKVVNESEEKKLSNFFKQLISLYSQLHQLPKFFVKFLLAVTECVKQDTAGICIVSGQIYLSVLETMTESFFNLPYGQILELWKIFNETYTTFSHMSQLFVDKKGAVLLFAQIFSCFLLHSKLFDATVPSVIFESFGDMIETTIAELGKNVSIFLEADAESTEGFQIQQAFLIISYAIGEVKLFYNENHDDLTNSSLTLKFSESPLDCSLLLSFLSKKHLTKFSDFLNGEDKFLSYLTFQLLLQKVRGLLHKGELSGDETAHIHSSLFLLLTHAKNNIESYSSWDNDVCSLNSKNYGTAVWRNLLKFLPLVIDFVDKKALFLLCSHFRDIILLKNSSPCGVADMNLKSVLTTALHSSHYHESKRFQTAFIASVWKFDSVDLLKKRSAEELDAEESFLAVLSSLGSFRTKWLKFAESTPRCNEEEGTNVLWSSVKETCDILNNTLQSDSVARPKLKSEIFNVVQLLECMPLEYLLHQNQVRCVIGLSVLLFLVPDSCEANDAQEVAGRIADAIQAIFKGIRRVWLFDFVDGIAYLRELGATIERLTSLSGGISLKWTKPLITCILSSIVKNSEQLATFEAYFKEANNTNRNSEINTFVLLQLLRNLVQTLGVKNTPEFKEVRDKQIIFACSTCVKQLKKSEESLDHPTIFSLQLECYIEVLNALTSPKLEVSQEKREKMLKGLPKVFESAMKHLSNLPDSDYKQDCENVCFRFFSNVCRQKENLSSFILGDFHQTVWNIFLSRGRNRGNDPSDSSYESVLTEEEGRLLQSLFSVMSEQEILDVLQEMRKQLEAHSDTGRLKYTLDILLQLIECAGRTPEPKLEKTLLVELVTQINCLALDVEDSESNLTAVKLPLLEFLASLLKLEKVNIPERCIVLCYHSCITGRLEALSSNLPAFIPVFNAVGKVIYTLLMKHSIVVLSSTAVYLSVVSNLVKSLVKAASQSNMSKWDQETRDRLLSCAQNLEKLLTMTASNEKKFEKLAPYIIADYIDSVKRVTLEMNIKMHLLLGLNRLLDLCSDDAIKMMDMNLEPGCREIFSTMVKNFKQHEYRGNL